MLPTFITIAVIIAVIVLWIISTQRRLVVLDENISNAMSQIRGAAVKPFRRSDGPSGLDKGLCQARKRSVD